LKKFLTPKEKLLVEFAIDRGSVTAEEVGLLFYKSKEYRDASLNKLIRLGLLKRVGYGVYVPLGLLEQKRLSEVV